jgi:hypothetical protein
MGRRPIRHRLTDAKGDLRGFGRVAPLLPDSDTAVDVVVVGSFLGWRGRYRRWHRVRERLIVYLDPLFEAEVVGVMQGAAEVSIELEGVLQEKRDRRRVVSIPFRALNESWELAARYRDRGSSHRRSSHRDDLFAPAKFLREELDEILKGRLHGAVLLFPPGSHGRVVRVGEGDVVA